MDLAPDFEEFIASLTARGVEFLVVGAFLGREA
jgi:preprotein translocase subunit Sss1